MLHEFTRLRAWCVATGMIAMFAIACGGTQEPGASLTLQETDHGFVSSRFDPSTEYILALDSYRGRLLFIDPDRGEVDAVLRSGRQPMVLPRPSANQLLVSGYPDKADGTGGATLRVYELADGGPRLGATYDQPHRIACKIFCNNLALSGDERYLFYPGVTGVRQDIPGCASGEIQDGLACDDFWVFAIDLEAAAASPGGYAGAQLKQRCGFAFLAPGVEDTALAACSGEAWIVGGDGRVEQTIETAGLVLGFERADGTPVTVYQSAAILHRPRGADLRLAPLDVDQELVPFYMQQTGDLDEVLIGYRYRGTFVNGVHGIVRVDLRTMRVRYEVKLDDAQGFAPRGDRGIAVLRADGAIEILDGDGRSRLLPVSLWQAPAGVDEDWHIDEWALIPS